MLVDEPFAKALQFFKTCMSVNDNLSEKLISPLNSPTTFDERFRIGSVTFFYSWF